MILLISILGLICNIAIFLCTTYNSPMATTVTGNVKDLGSMLIGIICFPDVEPTPLFIFGLFISVVGAGVYTFAKWNEHSKTIYNKITV